MKEESRKPRGKSTDTNALLMDAQTGVLREECAKGMEQKSRSNYAAEMDATIMPYAEECVVGTEQRSSDVVKKDAPINLSKKECA